MACKYTHMHYICSYPDSFAPMDDAFVSQVTTPLVDICYELANVRGNEFLGYGKSTTEEIDLLLRVSGHGVEDLSLESIRAKRTTFLLNCVQSILRVVCDNCFNDICLKFCYFIQAHSLLLTVWSVHNTWHVHPDQFAWHVMLY